MSPEGSPEGLLDHLLGGGCGLWSCAFHLQMPGPPSPHGAQKECGDFPSGKGWPVAELSAGGGWLDSGSEWVTPPTTLEVCEDFCVHRIPPHPPSPSHPFQGCLLTGLGWPMDGGRAEGGSWKPCYVCTNGALSLWPLEGVLRATVCVCAHWSGRKGCTCLKELSSLLTTIQAGSTNHTMCPQG